MTEKEAYKKGMMRAIWMYAVWREGEQRVGDGTRTYQQALKGVDRNVEHYWPEDCGEVQGGT